MKINYISLLSFLFIMAFCSAAYAKDDGYIIGREDVLEIMVWESPDLSKKVTVENDGTISYGVLGKITVIGITPGELQSTITKKLAEGYMKDPKVSVTIAEFNSKKILVFGEVGKPGLYKIRQEVPLLEMLFLVGGVKSDAKRMTVIRPQGNDLDKVPAGMKARDLSEGEDQSGDGNTVQEVDLMALLSKGDLSQNIMIKPGDTIYVATGTGEKFYVLGQVNNPGPIEWTGEITVLEAIKLAEGPTDLAALNRILVRKGTGDNQTKIKVNVLDIMKGKKKDDTVVQPGNVIIVPRSWV